MDFLSLLSIELFKAGLSAGLLYFSWCAGQKIVSRWDLKKKTREIDVQISQQLHTLIGEWKAVWRTWKVLHGELSQAPATQCLEWRWRLLDRAAIAEGMVEAILLRTATARFLQNHEIVTLGLFRQAFQQLRQSIRDQESLPWTRQNSEYWLFHDLTVRVYFLLEREGEHTELSSTDCERQLKSILAITSGEWEKSVKRNSNFELENSKPLTKPFDE